MQRKIIGYARVNTPEQIENAQALKQQVERLKEVGATEIFTDLGSGMAEDRTQLNLMMDLVRAGGVEEVVVTRIDRLTRQLPQLSQFIVAFAERGINLKVLDQQLDLSTPIEKLTARLLEAVAE